MGLLETIQSAATDIVESQPSTLTGKVKSYYDGAVTVETSEGTLENIPCVNVPKIGTNCIVLPVDGDYQCIPNEVIEESMIYALGLGKFTINDEGHLIYDLGIGVSNYMSINNNGHLLVNLDSATNQRFSINDNGNVIYE